jgi:hypothetical protein
MHPGEFGLREPDAMAEHGAPADQTVMVIDVEEVLPLRKELGDEGDLVAVLGDVGLHIQLRMKKFSRPTPKTCAIFRSVGSVGIS